MLVTVIPRKRELLANLTPAIGASGPHDFAVRFSHARQSQPSRPSLPDPRFVTNAHTPLWWDGMAIEVKMICLRDQARSYATHWHDGQISEMLSSFICWSDVFFSSPLVGARRRVGWAKRPHPLELNTRRRKRAHRSSATCGWNGGHGARAPLPILRTAPAREEGRRSKSLARCRCSTAIVYRRRAI